MSAVDFIVEFNHTTFLIEIKDINRQAISKKRQNKFIQKMTDKRLRREIAKKYSDTMLYKLAEQTISLQTNTQYLVLLEASSTQIPSPLRVNFMKELKDRLPFLKPDDWQHALLDDFQLHDLKSWNKYFPHFPVTRLS